MSKLVELTQEQRNHLIDLCVHVSEDIGEPKPRDYFEGLSDLELDLESDWYWELSFK